MNSRLDNLKNSNPLYKDMDDEQILTTNYNLYYKDKLSYDSFKQQMTQPLTMQEQNKIALRRYQEKQNITQEDIQNYLNYKETEELKSKGEIGFLEGFTKNNVSDFIPFVDYVADGVEAKQMRDIISRAYKGETLTQEETQKLRQFNKELKEDEVRGYTILGSLSSNIGNIFRVPLEFWITGGVAGGLGIGLVAGKEAPILTKIAYGVVNAGTYTALQSPTAVYSAYQSRQLANMLKITDKGEEFFNKMDNAENFSLKELFKATGDVYISNATELAGGNLLKGIVAGTGKLANKTTQILLKKDISTLANPIMEKMLPYMKKASQSVFNDNLQNVVAKMGWNGFVEEVFEEWLEQPLRFAIGLEDDKYTFENFLKSMKMSTDEFLITIGAVAIQGGVSYSTAKLYNKLRNKGVDKDKALNHLSTMTEKQKVNYLQQLEKYETEQDTQWYNDYINQLKNDFVKQGETQERVEKNLKLLDNVFIRYAINQGTSRKDIVENLILKSNNQNTRLQEQDLINKINNDLLPEFKQTFNKENLDKQDLLNILKSIKEKKATINKDKSKSLIQFLISNGGVFDERGDLKSQDLNKQYRGLIRDTRFINRKDRTTKENIQYDTSLDNQFKLAWQNGYFPEIQDFRDVDGVNTLINAINEEIGGNARYSSKDTDVNIQTEQAEEFISQLEEAGLDINDLVKLQELDNINKKTEILNQELQNKIESLEKYIKENKDNKELEKFDKKIKNTYKQLSDLYKSDIAKIIKEEKYEEKIEEIDKLKTLEDIKDYLDKYDFEEYEENYKDFNDIDDEVDVSNDENFKNFIIEELKKLAEDHLEEDEVDWEKRADYTKNKEEEIGYDYDTLFYEKMEKISDILDTLNIENILNQSNQSESTYLYIKSLYEEDSIFNFEYRLSNHEDKHEKNAPAGGREEISIGDNTIEILQDILTKMKNYQQKYNEEGYEGSLYQTAYHGSPYNFDKFTLEHIGEGEGVQAYGYGLYFALNKETAEGYKNKLKDLANLDKDLLDVAQDIIHYANKWGISLEEAKQDKLNNVVDSEYKEKIKKIDTDLLKGNSRLYEVEIPNDDVMLFIQKNYNQQSESVKKSIDDIIKKEISQETKNDFEKRYNQNLEYYIKNNDFSNNERINIGFTDIWGALRFFLKDFSDYGEKRTSEIFNKHGIEGIRYKNYIDGECAVVFNDKAISIIEKFNQQQNKEALAQIQFKDTEAIITLFENANASSLTHEMGHYFLRLTQALANSGNVVAQKDLEAIRKWLKNDGSPFTVEQEELFARSYEGYLRRGIAPSSRLQEVFNKLSEWLRDVYKSIKELNINLSRDVIDFFDNYLSYDIDTSNAELQNKINDLQSQIDKEVNTLMQEGMNYNTAYDLVSDKYQERIDRIKQELQDKSRSSKDYDFNKVVLDLKEQENNKLRNYINSSKKAMKDWMTNSLMTTENILKGLAPELYYKMNRYYASLSVNRGDTMKRLNKFITDLNNIKKENIDDYYILWTALNNRFNDKIQELLDKYNIYDDYMEMREILDDVRLQALSVGVDVGYLENYFPRSLKADTRNEFLEQLRKDESGKEIANDIIYNLELIRREKGPIDIEQETKYINNFLRGYVPRSILPLTVIDNLRKPRNIDIIQPQYLKYFEEPTIALHRYVYGAIEDFYKRKLFGMENQDISKLRRRILDLNRSLKTVQETSAGKIKRNVDYKLKFTKLAKEEQVINLLKKNQQDFTQEEKDLLIKLNQEIENINKNIEYNEKANAYAVKNKRIKDIKDEIQQVKDKIKNIKIENQEFNMESSIGYLIQNSEQIKNLKQEDIDKVKNVIRANLEPAKTEGFLTKLAIKTSSLALLDITNSVNQLKDFANSFAEYGIINTIKSVFNRNIKIKMEDLGIDNIIDNIQEDRWKFMDRMIKANGLVFNDKLTGKQAIRAQFLQTQELLKNNDADMLREIELFFGNEAQDVINDLKELKNLDSKAIRQWAYFKLNQIRPLNNLSNTMLYLTSSRLGKIVNILKKYAVKQLNLSYSRVYKEALNGNYKKAARYGTELFLFTLFIGTSIDSAKDLIWGMIFGFDEEPEKYITDNMIDNIILFNLIGRYNVSKVSRDGVGTGFFEFMFKSPLVDISNDLYKDFDKLMQGDLEIQDVRTMKYLPFGKTTKKILKEIND